LNQITTIWLVEDSTVDLFINSRVLAQSGFAGDVLQVPSPEDALNALATSAVLPDLILLDIRMPEMDGFEFLEKMATLPKAIPEKVKIILLSSSIDPVDYQRALTNPLVLAFIPKPLTVEKFNNLKW
jgi:CheY-like chemotaxis protein